MPFTGKTEGYDSYWPDDCDDLSDIVGVVSPYETPLLCHIGDADSALNSCTTSIIHEWMDEDKFKKNLIQRFTASVRVSKNVLAARNLALCDELDYQKQERLRELLRDLEATVLIGKATTTWDQDKGEIRGTMNGIIPMLKWNVFHPGFNGFPSDRVLTEQQLDGAIRRIYETSGSTVDTIVVNGFHKRQINKIIADSGYSTAHAPNPLMVYENNFGVFRVVLARAMPSDSVLLLDSRLVHVIPVAVRSFHYKRMNSTDEYEAGEISGEYTVELRNEKAHGLITGLADKGD